ncbi:MAG: hypothetical protein J6Q85_03360 [Clostridia bacterium]|nr:hypothetical protein [Clostridia bacterium]
MIIYAKSNYLNPSAIEAYETPIKMIIEHTCNTLERSNSIAKTLFNFEKSNRYGETIITSLGFDTFSAVSEGEAPDSEIVCETFSKFIEHIQFMKEFVISAEMMEDATLGLAASAKQRAESFARAYYKTINKICEQALINADRSTMKYNDKEIDLRTIDNLPLFHSGHYWGTNEIENLSTQSNYFWGDIFNHGSADNRTPSVEVFEEALSNLSIKLRNMYNDRGEASGYNADTIILPGNRPIAEILTKKVCGSLGAIPPAYSGVSAHFGAWNVVILPNWRTNDDRVMIMSSEANKELCGNMLFNRIPLTVSNWVDKHTGNYIWNGRCRFGVGFGNYRHIVLAIDSTSAVQNASKM